MGNIVGKVIQIDACFADIYKWWLGNHHKKYDALSELTYELSKSSSSSSSSDDDDDDERKRMVEDEFEDSVIERLDALASAAVAFVEKTHNHKFFHRVARADAATERIFDYFFEESKHSFDELSGVSISADQ